MSPGTAWTRGLGIMSYRWYQKGLDVKMLLGTRTLLFAAGEAMQNQMVYNAHVDSGLLSNSINYRTDEDKRGEFGSVGEAKADETVLVSKPTKDFTVRVGSAVKYAAAQEKHNGWASKSYDQIIASKTLERLADKVFKI